MSNVIKVPRPSRLAYNPHRPLEKNLLIRAQVEHFREAELNLPEHLRTGINIADVKTEGQAGHYIRKVTRAIHESGGREPQKVRTAG
jgi:hypothetical protein